MQENAYLMLDGETIVCKYGEQEKFKLPFDNIENIVCFSYLGCSPALMGKCAEKLIPITFLSPQGRFLAKVSGGTRGNVFLRVAQLEKFRDQGCRLAQNTVAAKIINNLTLIARSRHDHPELREDERLNQVIQFLKQGVEAVYKADTLESILGIEGNCARQYFSIFDKLLTHSEFRFHGRSKHPPLDEVNAVLSFVYTLYTHEFAAALETVGLDSCIGYYHTLRSGRYSLACDLVEEARCIVERFVLTLFNWGKLQQEDFDKQASGAIFLSADGRSKVLQGWQSRKRETMPHPYLKQTIQCGLLPYVQSNLLAKFVRGEIEEYPSYLNKQR